MNWRDIERQSGFSRDAIRRIHNFALIGSLLISSAFTMLAFGGDISPGYVFVAGEQNITHTKLNSIVGGASISPTFFTGKTVAFPTFGDDFLFYSASAQDYRRATFESMVLSNTNLITAQTEDTSPGTNDLFLTYSITDGAFRKVQLQNVLSALVSSNLFALATPTDASNLFTLQLESGTMTNLAFDTAPILSDTLWIWDSTNNTNRQIALGSLMTNVPTTAHLTNTDSFRFVSTFTATNPVLSQINVTNLAAGLITNLPAVSTIGTNDRLAVFSGTNAVSTNNFAGTFTFQQVATNIARHFVSTNITLQTGALNADIPHGLGAIPTSTSWVLVCTTAELGYSVGDEVNVMSTEQSGGSINFSVGANLTNIFIATSVTNAMRIINKTSGAITAAVPGHWALKGYATYVNW